MMVIFKLSIFCTLLYFAVGITCDYKGKAFRIGDEWVAEDRCNLCTCQPGGTVSCETKNCTAVMCHDNGRNYNLGETYMASDGCNECICSVTGAVCTKMNCWNLGAGVSNTRIPRCYYFGSVYTVGDAFGSADGCNRCICSEKEIVLCTKMFCPPPTLKPPETTKTPQCVYNGRVHSFSETFKSIDGCNTCHCAGNGQVACTLKLCPPTTQKVTTIPTTEPSTTQQPIVTTTLAVVKCNYNGRVYSEGDGFKSDDGCNTCSCLKGGNIACTEMFCQPTSTAAATSTPSVTTQTQAPKAVSTTATPSATIQTQAPKVVSTTAPVCTYNGQTYNVGDSFKADDGCNTCRCVKSETVACTKMYCPSTTQTPETSPVTQTALPKESSTKEPTCRYSGIDHAVGVSFSADDGCNTCHCGESGQVICSTLPCPSLPTQTCVYFGQIHAVGESFKAKDGCNTCRCGPNKEISCTKMFCPPLTTMQGTVSPSVEMVSTTAAAPIVSTGAQIVDTKSTETSVPSTKINHLKITMNR